MRSSLKAGYEKLSMGKAIAGAREALALFGPEISLNCDSIRPELVANRIYKESRNDPRAVSRENEQGLLQLYPRTVRKYHVQDPFNPAENIRAGCQLWNDWTSVLARKDLSRWRCIGDLAWDFDYFRGWGWQGMCWLETSIGPGATPALARLATPQTGQPFEDIIRWLATPESDTVMRRQEKRWGSQSPELVASRVGSALASVEASMEMAGTEQALAGLGLAAILGMLFF